MDNHKRLSADVTIGDFAIGEFDRHLEQDFEKLCVYDNLLRLDIHEFYGRLYTHYLSFNGGDSDRYLTNLNMGATNGLIMGNYLSLYFAEQHLSKISQKISERLREQGIECEFSYFSDDFYFFCNSEDNEKVEKSFQAVLEKFDLEANTSKEQVWNYESFNSDNMIARYWKKIIADCNLHYRKDKRDNRFVFINQLVYRAALLPDMKKKRVLITNFFKTEYFQHLEDSKYVIKEYDYYQLCHLYGTAPEAMLYSIDKFKGMEKFDMKKLERFFEVRYVRALHSRFHEIQLYYFYAIVR